VLRGTSRYYSPELLDNQNAQHTIESDIWAWGCLAAEIMTGQSPYHQILNEMAVLLKITLHELPAVIDSPEISFPLQSCLRDAWKIEPAERQPIRKYRGRILLALESDSFDT